MQELRHLNFDDLYLLKFLSLGYSLTEVAVELNISQPAISQRLKKMESVFDMRIIRKDGRKIHLTKEGELLCRKSTEALAVMSAGSFEKNKITNINVGTRPEVGASWLWPAIADLSSSDKKTRYHISFGSGEEILANLGSGKLDVVLTSAPVTVKEYGSVDIAEENYLFVASSKVAKKITKIEDLKEYLLIEHDRSFPFQRYLPTKVRQKIKFADVWFVESSELMLKAISEGEGVGIIPEYLFLSKRSKPQKLQAVKLNMKLSSDYFRLVYRKDRNIDFEVQALAEKLKKLGLQ